MEYKLKISKVDALKRQLETAIRLYFDNGDPVSIHTLAAAVYNLLRDLNAKRGNPPLILKDQIKDWVKVGHENEVWKILNRADNFFKHANIDPDSEIDFNPKITEDLMFEACLVYPKLFGQNTLLFRLFFIWYSAHHPNVFNLSEEDQKVIPALGEKICKYERKEFFEKASSLIN